MAQQREVYVKSLFLDIANDERNGRDITTTDVDGIKNKNSDFVIGYCLIDTNDIQYNAGIRLLHHSFKGSSQANNEFRTYRNQTHKKENALGIEFGIGKRLPYQKLLFIPSVNLSFYHSTAAEFEKKEYYLDKVNSIESDQVTDLTGGNFFVLACELSQGMYYAAGKHWKIGGALNGAIGWRRIYGKSIQITRDLANNTVSSPYILENKINSFFISPSIQLGVRYTFITTKNGN